MAKLAATMSRTTVTKTNVTKLVKPRAAVAAAVTLPKTGDAEWIELFLVFALPGRVPVDGAGN